MPWLALGRENYRLFFAGQIVSQSGRWMQGVAQAWLVLDLTGSALALGGISVVQHVPILLFSLFAGPLADRFRTRRFLMALQGLLALQAGILAMLVISGQVQLWEIYVFAALWGTTNAIDGPTRQAFVSELVDRSEIQSAVGLNSSVQNAARIVGPALGGVVIAAWGTGWCFALNALAFVAAFAALVAMREDRLRPAAAAAAGRLREQIVHGLRYVAGERELLVPLALLGLVAAIGLNWQVTLPLLARYSFGTGATGFGVMNAALGLGSLSGSLLVASRPPAAALRLGGISAAFSVLLMSLALAPDYAAALLLLVAAGCVSVLFSAGVNTAVQLRTRPEYRGRVLGLFFLVWAGGSPFGAALTGAVAETWDIRVALALSATLCLAGSGAAIAYLVRRGSPATVP
ncbi:MAG: MFS transporter [Chloroflexi bacterium]|nr:MFS transporter [Chloroflexota bacterium]